GHMVPAPPDQTTGALWFEGAAWWSPDGRTWMASRINGLPDGGFLSGPLVVADGFLAFEENTNQAWASSDGRVWDPVTDLQFGSSEGVSGAAETAGRPLITGEKYPQAGDNDPQ